MRPLRRCLEVARWFPICISSNTAGSRVKVSSTPQIPLEEQLQLNLPRCIMVAVQGIKVG